MVTGRRTNRSAGISGQLILVGVTALVALAAGGGGAYLWQKPAVTALAAERDQSTAAVTGLRTRISTLENQARNLGDQNQKLTREAESLSAEMGALHAAVQVSSSPRDVAVAYGKARMTRNNPWIKALMTDQLAASHQFREELSNQTATRYAIEKELKGASSWTYVVRVWEAAPGRGEIGYTDSTLDVVKVGDFYKIRSVTLADHYTQNSK